MKKVQKINWIKDFSTSEHQVVRAKVNKNYEIVKIKSLKNKIEINLGLSLLYIKFVQWLVVLNI